MNCKHKYFSNNVLKYISSGIILGNTSLDQKMERPIGVTVIAILVVIVGIMSLFGGIPLVILGAFLSTSFTDVSTGSPFVGSLFGVLSAGLGAVLLVVGVGYIIMSYGLLKGKGWAWTITIILTLIGIAINIISAITGGVSNMSTINSMNGDANSFTYGIVGSVIGIAISIAIIYYLYRPRVRLFFGKTSSKISAP
jgi:ABC-type Fe3+ transport system permease subunit